MRFSRECHQAAQHYNVLMTLDKSVDACGPKDTSAHLTAIDDVNQKLKVIAA